METNEQRQRKTHETELETNQLRTQPKTWQLTMLQVCVSTTMTEGVMVYLTSFSLLTSGIILKNDVLFWKVIKSLWWTIRTIGNTEKITSTSDIEIFHIETLRDW